MLNDLIVKYMNIAKGLEKENATLKRELREADEYVMSQTEKIKMLEEEITELKALYEYQTYQINDLETYIDELEDELELFEDEELPEDIDEIILKTWEKMKVEYLKNKNQKDDILNSLDVVIENNKEFYEACDDE